MTSGCLRILSSTFSVIWNGLNRLTSGKSVRASRYSQDISVAGFFIIIITIIIILSGCEESSVCTLIVSFLKCL